MQTTQQLLKQITLSQGIWWIAGLVFLAAAVACGNYLAAAAAIVGLVSCLVRFLVARQSEVLQESDHKGDTDRLISIVQKPAVTIRSRVKSNGIQPRSPSALVNEMMLQGRYAVLLRPEVLSNLSQDQADRAAELLTQQMAVIRGGRINIHPDNDESRRNASNMEVHPFFIDRHAVTNAAYQEFVDLDGYRKPELWAADVRDSLELFVDLTNHPGPRSWADGKYDEGLSDHPVTGISWYEADAFARWAGKRLPTDAEWVKGALSPRTSMVSTAPRRRYPWGNSYAKDKANLWSSLRGTTVGVCEFASGSTVDGVCQMVGNVWEWTADPLATWIYSGELSSNCSEYRSLRGGAFDTYIESQASPLAASGDNAFARKHNIGFRCVLDLDAVPSSVVPVM
jgi:gamma-glutamyl hercynylcysteine S-oxide synthase